MSSSRSLCLHFRYLSRLLQRAPRWLRTDLSPAGLPNPNPVVVPNWENSCWPELGSTAGIDDPTDGHIWAYERCGASSFGGGVPVNCDTNRLTPSSSLIVIRVR